MERPWYVYVLECADGSYYCGCSTDVERRLREHNTGTGAKYTRYRSPCVLVVRWKYQDMGEALKAEAAFKKLTRAQKEKAVLECSWCGGEEVF